MQHDPLQYNIYYKWLEEHAELGISTGLPCLLQSGKHEAGTKGQQPVCMMKIERGQHNAPQANDCYLQLPSMDVAVILHEQQHRAEHLMPTGISFLLLSTGGPNSISPQCLTLCMEPKSYKTKSVIYIIGF